MTIDPYAIQIEPRPLRIAFIVNRTAVAQLDEVIEYNRNLWGGRLNPIILSDGSALDDASWGFLQAMDPDLIQSLVPLSDVVRQRIQATLTPMRVEQPIGPDPSIDLVPEPLGILPNAATVSRVARNAFVESTLTMYDVKDSAPASVRLFVERNFGRLHEGPGVLRHRLTAMGQVRRVTVPIDTTASFAAELTRLGTYHAVVFASQLCAGRDTLPESDRAPLGDDFALIVGDSADDVAYASNRATTTAPWLRGTFNQLWVPTELARSAEVREGLRACVTRFADSTGNEQPKGVQVLSTSLTDAELRDIASGLVDNKRLRVRHAVVGPVPPYIPRHGYPVVHREQQELQRFRGYSVEEKLVMTHPDLVTAPTGSLWCADVRVQFRPERYRHVIRLPQWWQFPYRNTILEETGMFSRECRVRRDRYPSVLMERRSIFGHDDGTLTIAIPSDQHVGRALVCGPDITSLEAPHAAPRPIRMAYPSDKGQTLAGVLSLFPHLYAAFRTFESRYWRVAFEAMANVKPATEEQSAKEIRDFVMKHGHKWNDTERRNDAAGRLAAKVVEHAKRFAGSPIAFSMKDFAERATEEAVAHNATKPKYRIPVEAKSFRQELEAELRDDLSSLMDCRVLRMGVVPKCPHCGFRTWQSLDDAAHVMVCAGCGTDHRLSAEEPWRYQLNSLVRSGVTSQGTVPVLLVIGALERRARSSFYFVPPMALEIADAAEASLYPGDLDIVAVVDGEFVIGEVKASGGLFEADDFSRTSKAALTIRPDRVLFAALDGKKTRVVEDGLVRVKAELEPLGIDVRWFAFGADITEPTPFQWGFANLEREVREAMAAAPPRA